MGSDEKLDQLASHPATSAPFVLVEDADLLLGGTYTREGFDLVILGENGERLVIADYFSFNPPPLLMLANGNGVSPAMVRSLLHDHQDEVMFAGPANATSLAEEIGTVRFVFGNVTRTGADGIETPLRKGDTLYEGDEINVQGRGYVRATMNDGTRFNLGANARAILDGYAFNEAQQVGSFEATVMRGGFHYTSGKIGTFGSGRNHSTIKTPSAIIGIRGSELDGVVESDGQTIVIHKSGILTITDINGNNPVTLDVPGNTSVIVVNGNPSFTPQATPDQEARVEQSLPPANDPADDTPVEETTTEERTHRRRRSHHR